MKRVYDLSGTTPEDREHLQQVTGCEIVYADGRWMAVFESRCADGL